MGEKCSGARGGSQWHCTLVAAGRRNRYERTPKGRNVINRDLSRWRLQLGARYIF
ncbi:MAG TPA: hypothetical protein VFK04_19620 [Gemmatimonadaceae bacterium]|nr:hypothetical protein [Gemmatimonadaceae bacterium]